MDLLLRYLRVVVSVRRVEIRQVLNRRLCHLLGELRGLRKALRRQLLLRIHGWKVELLLSLVALSQLRVHVDWRVILRILERKRILFCGGLTHVECHMLIRIVNMWIRLLLRRRPKLVLIRIFRLVVDRLLIEIVTKPREMTQVR